MIDLIAAGSWRTLPASSTTTRLRGDANQLCLRAALEAGDSAIEDENTTSGIVPCLQFLRGSEIDVAQDAVILRLCFAEQAAFAQSLANRVVYLAHL